MSKSKEKATRVRKRTQKPRVLKQNPLAATGRVSPRLLVHRITPDQLRDFDDIATDLLIDSVYPEVIIRKNRYTYSSACENRKDIVWIIKNVIIKQKDPRRAVSQLLQVPDLKSFSDNLASANEKEDFQEHIRKYVDLYLPDCPFEVSRTTRYSPVPEAALKARKKHRERRGHIFVWNSSPLHRKGGQDCSFEEDLGW
ncbi:hypothetical protein BGZ57DRAFT_932464 [Hyaloscypha finlandica]|nr:hypothetical protein BGZ57DRAFT_932464 [Hyaloscypha finlandica]